MAAGGGACSLTTVHCGATEDDGGQIIGVFPAALDPQHRDTVVSHPGLTYGGVVHKEALRGAVMLEVLQEIYDLYAGFIPFAGGLLLQTTAPSRG
jgi:hypothetical protein